MNKTMKYLNIFSICIMLWCPIIPAIQIDSSLSVGWVEPFDSMMIPFSNHNQDRQSNCRDSNNDNVESDFPPTVFIEACVSEDDPGSTDVDDILAHLSSMQGANQFHFITLIEGDINATNRVRSYNVEEFPVVFINGGYEVVLGDENESVYEQAIQSALARETPDVNINLTTEYNRTSDAIEFSVQIINNEPDEYNGRLRVYLAECQSTKYQDWDGYAWMHVFLTFSINKYVTIPANSMITETEINGANMYEPENLMVYAVLFSNEKHEKYQDPDQEKYAFNAYYVDACDGVQVEDGGNLPPYISISHPKKGKTYFMGNQVPFLNRFTFRQAILIGRCNFTAQAYDDESIEKVELYIDEELIKTFSSEPYEYTYRNRNPLQCKHIMKFKAYDNRGKYATASIDIFSLSL